MINMEMDRRRFGGEFFLNELMKKKLVRIDHELNIYNRLTWPLHMYY